MALTPEQSKALLESLFAMPDKAKVAPKAKAKPVAKSATVKPKAIRTTLGLTSQGYLPALRIITVMHQHCETCNNDSEYVLPAVVRFEAKNGRAIEIPAAVEEHLPLTVQQDWQQVTQCPRCLAISRDMEDFICLNDAPRQLELFI